MLGLRPAGEPVPVFDSVLVVGRGEGEVGLFEGTEGVEAGGETGTGSVRRACPPFAFVGVRGGRSKFEERLTLAEG